MVLTTLAHILVHERPRRKSNLLEFFLSWFLAIAYFYDIRIVSYMTKQSLPAVSILTAETLGDFKTADKVVLVAYFNADDKESNTTFTTVAEKLRDDYLFGASNDAEVAKAEGVTAPALVLYKSFDEGKAVYAEAFDTEAIEKFVKTASIPLIGEVGPETYAGYMATGIPLAYNSRR